jgi:hydrogenase nickel incorporation protein HypA/HybF
MHELSIALNILDIVENTVKEKNIRSVKALTLEIGDLSGVESEALTLAMQTACQGTILEHAKTEIIHIEAQASCRQCRHTFPCRDFIDICPECGSAMFDIVQGKELRIKNIVAEE